MSQASSRDVSEVIEEASLVLERRSESDESGSESAEFVRKGRGKAKEYGEVLRFGTYQEALDAVESGVEGQRWTKRYERETFEGDKVYFSCENNPKCPKMLFILRHADSLDVSVWLCDADHVHHEKAKGILPVATVDLVKALLENGMIN